MLKFAVIFAILIVLFMQQIIYNPSISLTPGYYFTYKAGGYEVNDLVVFCVFDKEQLVIMHSLGLPYAKDCPYESPYLMKRIVAKAYDYVSIESAGVRVNGYLYPLSRPLSHYKNIYFPLLKTVRFRLEKDEFLVLGDTPHSYDSRYFGVVKSRQIYRKARLVLAANKLIL